MKKILLLLLLSLGSVKIMAQTLEVVIKQNGKIIESVEDIYTLKRSAFQFEIKANNIEGFLVGVTTDEDHYNEAVNFFEPDDLWFSNTGMAEALFNENKVLYLVDYAPSYWYYSDKNDHRFDKNPIGTAQKWTGKRTVNALYDIEKEQEITLKDTKESIYIYMYAPEYDENYTMIGRKSLFFGELKFVH